MILTRATLTLLLGHEAAERAVCLPRLLTTRNVDDVLTLADDDLNTRRVLLDEQDAPDRDTYRADPGNQPIPAAVVITEPPNGSELARLATTAQSGHGLDLTVVVLGPWPPGTTLDGTTTLTPGGPADDGPAGLSTRSACRYR